MNDAKFLIFNGDVQELGSFRLDPFNRATYYGDGLFETIRVFNGKPLFLDRHFERLKFGAAILGIDMGDFSFDLFQNLCAQILLVNQITGGARLRLTIIRKTGGYFSPLVNEADYYLHATEMTQNQFELPESQLKLGIYNGVLLKNPKYYGLKGISDCREYILAAIQAQLHNWDDIVLLDANGHVAECTSSNIMLVMGREILTPSLNSSCLAGVMRSVIINLLIDQGYELKECNIAPKLLSQADELWLLNSISGIRTAKILNQKEYGSRIAKSTIEELNKRLNLNLDLPGSWPR